MMDAGKGAGMMDDYDEGYAQGSSDVRNEKEKEIQRLKADIDSLTEQNSSIATEAAGYRAALAAAPAPYCDKDDDGRWIQLRPMSLVNPDSQYWNWYNGLRKQALKEQE